MLRFTSILALTAALATATPNGGTSLWYDKPAAIWTETLPVGNGNLGGIDKERIQFNEQTLWTGDELQMGSYQPFGDVFIDSPELAYATHYRRELDLSEAVHRTIFIANGVQFTRGVFSSHPDKVLVIRLTAAKPLHALMESSSGKWSDEIIPWVDWMKDHILLKEAEAVIGVSDP